MYKKVSTDLNFVDREKQTEKFWEDNDIFRKSMRDREGNEIYMFYDGPPTANGKPHIGHVLTRVIKDMIPRYRTMKGYEVPRKAGWDTHGLPVELEVEKLLGLEFKITPFSFFQPNSKGAEVLYETVREYIGDIDNQVVFDLFSGTGTIGQVLAPVAKKVIGVEIIEEAVEAAKENAVRNGLSNCRFIAGDVFKVLDEIEEKPDVIVLDPPRDGIHPKALPKILNYGVDKIVYISCKMTSLARDLEMMQLAGYRVEKMTAVDQFCETVHCETVVLLSHKKPDGHINVKVEFGEGEGKVPLDNIAKRAEEYKPKERVTYKMIKEYIEAKYGFKVHTAYIAEVKRDLGLPMYDAPNAVEELKQPRKHPTAEKVEAIKDALKYFKVI